MASVLSCETSDDTSENELLERSLSVWRGWSSIEFGDFTPIALDIHTACSIGHYEWVRTIIRKNEGIDLDRKNHGGWTPLMYACYIGHDNIVSLLISAGCCNMNAKNPRGLTPLMLAASCGNESVACTLVRRGANLELLDKSGWTALFHATYAGHQNFVAFLLEAEANKDAVDPNTGLTPFMVAASEGHEIIVQLFLQNGVNAHAKAFNGDMARSLALLNGYMKIVSLIDNQDLPSGRLRAEADLSSNISTEKGVKRRGVPHSQACLLNKVQSPSIRDGPEAIARMINRSRQPDGGVLQDLEVPRGYVTFPAPQEDKKETRLSYRDVTSPINQEDYRESSESREFDDYNDESNAFTKTGAITIKSSSSSSGGLMAALGLSLDSEDSHCSASGKFDDDNQALQPSVRNQTTSGKDFVEENEQLEYDVDGDSSRPLDSHSPSLNDTSSLSSSDQKQRSNNIGETNPKQPTCNSNVSLKDYFPLDLSFPPGHKDYPHETQEGVQNEARKPFGKVKLVSKVDGYLPKENMSQSEIVNRFLDNLTLTDSGIENHGSGDCLHSVPETEDSCEITQNNKDSQDPLIARQCIRSEELRILEGSERNKNESAQNKLKELSTAAFVKPVSKQQHFFSDNNNETFSHPTQLSPASANQSQPQQWAPHPPLNHHHPLHNRHKHHQYYGGRALPVTQDVKSNMYDILTSPNSLKLTSQKQPGINLPYLGNLPQQFIFSDFNSSPFAHMQANFNQNPYQCVTTEGNTVANIQQLYSNDNVNQYFHMSTTLPPSATAAQTSKGTNQSVHAVSGWSTDDSIDGLTNALQPMLQTLISLPPVIEQPPPLPALTHLPPVCASGAPSPSVVIPGHITSQPISVPQALSSAIQTPPNDEGPQDIKDMLSQLGLLKYLDKFEEQDVDLQVFLSLTDNDLKELGIKLFGPRKKMTNAIARWHSNAPAAKNSLEQAYADKLEGEMQEMAIQLNQAYENEERIKAQVSQEQQLRSVTESCLMEERSGWEQACQMLQTTRGKLRTLGEQQSRLRHYQKELRKQFEAWMTEAGDNNSNSGQRRGKNSNVNSHEFNTHTVDGTCAGENSKTNDAGNVKSCEITTCHNSSMGPKVLAAAEQMKRSDKCLKEMMQTLSTLVLNTDHILKSMQSLGSMSKDVT